MSETIRYNTLSVIVPVTERHDDLAGLCRAYRRELQGRAAALEMIFVFDGNFSREAGAFSQAFSGDDAVKVVKLSRRFGESTALTVGFGHARGEVIMTLPAYHQVESDSAARLLDALPGYDLVVGRRWPRKDGLLKTLRARIFHGALRMLTDSSFRDLGCGARAMHRRVLEEVRLYGDQHRFLPLLANRQGFRVREVDLPQAADDMRLRVYGPGVYAQRSLDLLTTFFLLKFTRRPLRFFGLIGSTLLVLGLVPLVWVVIQRLFFDVDLSDRPALLLSTMMVVLGVQVIALGLIGELIIFTHSKDLKEYAVEEVVEQDGAAWLTLPGAQSTDSKVV